MGHINQGHFKPSEIMKQQIEKEVWMLRGI
jgi:hypothetical protein